MVAYYIIPSHRHSLKPAACYDKQAFVCSSHATGDFVNFRGYR